MYVLVYHIIGHIITFTYLVPPHPNLHTHPILPNLHTSSSSHHPHHLTLPTTPIISPFPLHPSSSPLSSRTVLVLPWIRRHRKTSGGVRRRTHLRRSAQGTHERGPPANCTHSPPQEHALHPRLPGGHYQRG